MSTDTADSSLEYVRLAFSVPRGFEDVAWTDIHRNLPHVTLRALSCQISQNVIAAALSGYVFLSLPFGSALDECLNVYVQGRFWSVIRLYLSLQEAVSGDNEDATQNSALPVVEADICKGLEEERRNLPSRRSRQIQPTDAQKKRINRFRRHFRPLDIETTPYELAFLEQLERITGIQAANHAKLYPIWRRLKHPEVLQEHVDAMPESFAIKFERRTFLFPTLKSSKIAFHLAELYGTQLQDIAGRESVRANLENPDYDVLAELIQIDEQWHFFAGVGLPPSDIPRHRSSSRVQGRTTMLPQRAYCLSLLSPIFSQLRGPKNRKLRIVLDPCGGYGSIPLEVAGLAERQKLNLMPLSADYELPSLEKGCLNATDAGMGLTKGITGVDTGIRWTGYGFGHSGGFRHGIIDGVITDLPWGIRELTPSAVARLYPALLRFLGPAVAEGGWAVFLCVREKIFLRAVEDNSKLWELHSQRIVNVEGVQAHAFVIRRNTR